MKKIVKKIMWLGAIAALCIGFGTAASCGGKKGPTSDSYSSESSGGGEVVANYVYRISVKNAGDFGFRGVTVELRDPDTGDVKAAKHTNSSGFAYFMEEDITAGDYLINVTGLPECYDFADPGAEYYTRDESGTATTIRIAPTGELREGTLPLNYKYQLGEVMYDFTVTTIENKQITLSSLLETEGREAVLLNFWYASCTPCRNEFNPLDDSIKTDPYKDKVSVVAISTQDNKQRTIAFKDEMGLEKIQLVPTESNGGLLNAFFGGSAPQSIIVDRYGVIVWNHTGSMTAATDFQKMYDQLLGDNYEPTVISGTAVDDDQVLEHPRPSKDILNQIPSSKEVANVLGCESDEFQFRFQAKGVVTADDEEYDEYAFPWLISEDKTCMQVSNSKLSYSYSRMYVDFKTTKETALVFDYLLGSEEDADELYIFIDGTLIHQLSGNHTDKWNPCVSYVFKESEIGEHEMILLFNKNNEKNSHGDIVQIKNLRFEEVSEINKNPNIDANIIRQAATVKAPEGSSTQFLNYITPVFNETDGYYHVNEENGPLLFANLLKTSPWCTKTSLWILAYENLVWLPGGINYKSVIEEYAWEADANIVNNGYTPVTKALAAVLYDAVTNTDAYNAWDGETHENEWLELCVYYDHYGNTPVMEDPMKGITYHAAVEVTEGDNDIDVYTILNPRGFKHKFVPTQSGVYQIKSIGEIYSNGTVDPKVDTVCWVANEKRELLAYYDDPYFVEADKDADYNFDFYYYMEAGETYYLLLAFADVEQIGKYRINISYFQESYSYYENASRFELTYNETTGQNYLADAINYKLGEDGFYHVVNPNGELGVILYLDVNRPTALLANLYQINNQPLSLSFKAHCEAAMKSDYTGIRIFSVNGVDYTKKMYDYCQKAMENEGELNGFVAVDVELYNLLNTVFSADRNDAIENLWLTACYYKRNLAAGAQNPNMFF